LERAVIWSAKVRCSSKMKPRFRAEWEVSSEELCILASWFLSHWYSLEMHRKLSCNLFHFIPLICVITNGVRSGEGALPPPQQKKLHLRNKCLKK